MEYGLWNAPSHVRHLLTRDLAGPNYLRVALNSIPEPERDDWWDRVLFGDYPSFDLLPADESELPQGATPYLPCPLDSVLEAARNLALGPEDILVDVGAGTGRAAALLHFLSGATTVGIEIQKHLFDRAEYVMAGLHRSRMPMLHGDALELISSLPKANAYFLYCPFGGQILTNFLSKLAIQARTKRIRLSCVDMPALTAPWLKSIGAPHHSVHTYESVP